MLVVDNLHFAYKDSRILNGLYFDANEGELVGIVGPNGAGKSTLLRLISGVLKPANGCVSVNGVDLASLKPAQRARLVSVVPQNPQLPLHFKLLDLVLMGRNPHLRLMEWGFLPKFSMACTLMPMRVNWLASSAQTGRENLRCCD